MHKNIKYSKIIVSIIYIIILVLVYLIESDMHAAVEDSQCWRGCSVVQPVRMPQGTATSWSHKINNQSDACDTVTATLTII